MVTGRMSLDLLTKLCVHACVYNDYTFTCTCILFFRQTCTCNLVGYSVVHVTDITKHTKGAYCQFALTLPAEVVDYTRAT